MLICVPVFNAPWSWLQYVFVFLFSIHLNFACFSYDCLNVGNITIASLLLLKTSFNWFYTNRCDNFLVMWIARGWNVFNNFLRSKKFTFSLRKAFLFWKKHIQASLNCIIWLRKSRGEILNQSVYKQGQTTTVTSKTSGSKI